METDGLAEPLCTQNLNLNLNLNPNLNPNLNLIPHPSSLIPHPQPRTLTFP